MSIKKSMLMVSITTLILQGCANGSGASQGAKSGAVGGAVGGLVAGVLWGGNPIESAAKGAVIGGASGAAVGAVNDQSAKSKSAPKTDEPKPQPVPEVQQQWSEAQLQTMLGDNAYQGLTSLVSCQYEAALAQASIAREEQDKKHQLAGVWLEAMVYAEQVDVDALNQRYKLIVEQDDRVSNLVQAQLKLNDTLDQLQQLRLKHNVKGC